MTGRWVTKRPDAGRTGPVVLSDSTDRSQRLTGHWQGQVKHDRMRLVGKICFWNLTRNDRTLEAQSPVSCSGVFGQQMTVEIRRLLLNAV